MTIENIIYFALGFLIATLLAIVVMPSVWKRAVRLTRKRIEAAIPITMAEFRADKDQMRAEFALATRRLEMTVETLRNRLTEQLAEIETKKSEIAVLKAEAGRQAESQAEVQTAIEGREAAAHERIRTLEKQIADLTRRLQDAEFAAPISLAPSAAPAATSATNALAGLKKVFTIGEKHHTNESLAAIEEAHASITSAGTHLNALLAETGLLNEESTGKPARSLAQKLSEDDEFERLRRKIADVEKDIAENWDSGKADKPGLREDLGDIAATVSRLVYATDSDDPDKDESLFARIQKFVGESLDPAPRAPAANDTSTTKTDPLPQRSAALRNVH